MILQSLDELYDRLQPDPHYKVPLPGYSRQKISFKIVLRPDGEILALSPLVDPRTGRPRQVLVPGGAKPSGMVTKKSVAKKVQFLRSDVRFILGCILEDRVEDGSIQKVLVPEEDPFCFEAFREYHLEHEAEVADPMFSVVCCFLRNWSPGTVVDHDDWGDVADGQAVFQIQGEAEYVHQRQAVRDWWTSRAAKKDGPSGQCLVTGSQGPLARLHPKVKGVRGAQTAGATIAGFNDSAYCSYGKLQSHNAPVSVSVAFRYTAALNALLDGPMQRKHKQTLGDMTVVFWTDRPSASEDIFARFLDSGSAPREEPKKAQDESQMRKLRAFLRAIRRGTEAYSELGDDPEATRFYLLALSPNASRIAVRFFRCSSLGGLVDRLREHYRDIAIEAEPSSALRRGDPEFPAVWQLLRQTARESKAIPPLLAAPLLRAVMEGTPYPEGLLQAVIRRIRADRHLNYLRACVIKGYLVRNLKQEVPMSLDIERLDPAYRLGRLFAALEKTQRDALGEQLGTTLRDSFYSSASATPRTVFPRVLRTYQHHLGKMQGGRRVVRERLVQEILDPLESFPAHLGLADQGLFALGYYQQMRDFYRKKNDSEINEEETT